MADEIDIEEHDVFENPRIKDIFPDAVVIKTEIPDDEDAADEGDNFNEYHDDDFNSENTYHLSERTDKRIASDDHCNDEYLHFNNKIILGSKPSQNIDEAFSSDSDDNYDVMVLLEDWGPHLSVSPCYCKVCKILFPTVNALDAHKMTAHSFLVAINSPPRNKALKSTAKVLPNNNFAASKGLNKTQDSSKDIVPKSRISKLCNHCNTYFSDDNALVKHLYELLPIKTFDCEVCHEVFDTNSELVAHARIHVKISASSSLGNVSQMSDDSLNNAMFSCSVCTFWFSYKNCLVKHLFTHHGLINSNMKVKAFDSKCAFCVCKFSVPKYYNKHIQSVHAQNYSKKVGIQKVKQVKTDNVDSPIVESPKYKCNICKEIVNTKFECEKHRRMKHPDVIRKVLMTKIVSDTSYKCTDCNIVLDNKTAAIKHVTMIHPKLQKVYALINTNTKPTTVKVQNNDKNLQYRITADIKIDNAPIQKSAIFKCNLCPVHFVTGCVALCHSRRRLCDYAKKYTVKCDQCNRYFKSTDMKMHQLQHKFVQKLKVYVISPNVCLKIISKCPDCFIYFDEMKFWKHRTVECQNSVNKSKLMTNCVECQIPFDRAGFEKHSKIHKIHKLNCNDFIRLDYTLADVGMKIEAEEYPKVKIEKRKISTDDDSESTPVKRYKKNSMIFGNDFALVYCKTCKCYMNLKARNKHLTIDCDRINKRNCIYCGLCFSTKACKRHEKIHHTNKSYNLKMFRFVRINDLKEMIPPIPKYFPCKKCKVTFESLRSRRWHVCDEVSHVKCQICDIKFVDSAYKLHIQFHEYSKKHSNMAQSAQEKKMDEIPELLIKYEALQNMWNVLYLCDACDIVCDSYDDVVEHSQNHFNNMEHFGVHIKKCHICDLKFNADNLEKHKVLHSNNTVTRGSFTVIKYDYQKLIKNDWLYNFKNISSEQLQQILVRSIYRYNCNIKFEIIQEGPPEFTLYKCDKCMNFVDPNLINKHMEQCTLSCLFHGYMCLVCQLPFDTELARQNHSACHKNNPTMDKTSYRIVIFNKLFDSEYNKAIQPVQAPKIFKKPKLKLWKVYQCIDCQGFVVREKNIFRHSCAQMQRICNICGLGASRKNGHRHYEYHIKYPDFVKTNIKIIKFNPNSSNQILEQKQMQEQGIHEILEQKQEQPIHKGKETKMTGNFYNVYRCIDCNGYVVYRKSIPRHACKLGPYKYSCPQCGFNVSGKNTMSHKMYHLRFPNFVRSNFIITDFKCTPNGYKIISQEQQKSVAKLFKCQCGLHFITMKTMKNHLDKCNWSVNSKCTVSSETCSKCGLLFATDVLVSHLCSHHITKKYTKFEVKEITHKNENATTTVFECGSCGVLFTTKTSVAAHLRFCDTTNRGTVCDDCGLIFHTESIVHHKRIHDNEELTTKKFKVLTVNKKSFNTKDVRHKIVIYRCNTCNLNFLSKKTMLAHNSGHNFKSAISCSICGLRFSKVSMTTHEKVHHQNGERRRKDFIIKILKCKTVTEDNALIEDDNIADSKDMNRKGSVDNIETQSNIFDNGNINKADINVKNDRVRNSKDFKYTKLATDIGSSNSLVFKCWLCPLHCLKEGSLLSHIGRGDHGNGYPCDICGLRFSEFSLGRHQYIHHTIMNLTRDDITVIEKAHLTDDSSNFKKCLLDDLDEFDSEHIIYKCTTCLTHYHSSVAVVKHFAMGRHSIDSAYRCPYCKLTFSAKFIQDHHLRYPTKSHLTSEEFRIVEITETNYCSLKKDVVKFKRDNIDINADTRSSIDMENTRDTITEGNDTIFEMNDTRTDCDDINILDDSSNDSLDKRNEQLKNLYKCCICNTHYHDRKSIFRHLDDVNHIEPTTGTCQGCQLLFPMNILPHHTAFYHDTLNVTNSYFNIINVSKTDLYKFIDLFKCGKCGLHFTDASLLNSHINQKCVDSIEKCEKCFLDFAKECLNVHVDMHHNVKNYNVTDLNIVVPKEMPPDSVNNTNKISHPTPRQIFNNLVYKCWKCPLHLMTERALTSHINKEYHNTETEHSCDICGLIFSEPTLRDHKYLHHNKMKLGSEDIAVVSKAGNNIDSDADVINVCNFPNNVNDKRVLFRCNDCLVHLSNPELMLIHINSSHNIDNIILFSCPKCKLIFSISDIAEHYSTHHVKQNIRMSDYLVVAVSKMDDLTTIIKIMEEQKILYYSCKICGIDFKQKEEFDMHCKSKCHNNTKKTDENDGYEKDTIQTKLNRKTRSPELLKMLLDNNESSQGNCNLNIIYKCWQCPLHFLNALSLLGHFKNHITHSENTTSEVFNCEQCGLGFNKQDHIRHVCIHHTNLNLKREDICVIQKAEVEDVETTIAGSSAPPVADIASDTEIEKYTLYKCETCSMHLLTLSAVRLHLNYNRHNVEYAYVCPKCKLSFHLRTIQKHLQLHHSEMGVKSQNFRIILSNVNNCNIFGRNRSLDKNIKGCSPENNNSKESKLSSPPSTSKVDDESIDVINDSNLILSSKPNQRKYKVKLYKCGPCDVYFVNQSTCYKHACKHLPLDDMEFIECKFCKLQFTLLNLKAHIVKHHKEDFNLDSVLVEEYQPVPGKVPIIDIYYAGDKLQSKQVSTTTDNAKKVEYTIEDNKSNEINIIDVTEDMPSNSAENKIPEVDIKCEEDVEIKTQDETTDHDINKKMIETNTSENDLNKSPNVDEFQTFSCTYCSNTFKTQTARDFHISLDHLDGENDCPICGKTFNESILNDIHLKIVGDEFICCICTERMHKNKISEHADKHLKLQ